jgi:hypothetical protein
MKKACENCKYFVAAADAETGKCTLFGGSNEVRADYQCFDFKPKDGAKNKTPARGRNKRMSRNNTSGVTGVTWHARAGKWLARVTLDGKQLCLGYFTDKEEAAETVRVFRSLHGFSPGHGLPTEGKS